MYDEAISHEERESFGFIAAHAEDATLEFQGNTLVGHQLGHSTTPPVLDVATPSVDAESRWRNDSDRCRGRWQSADWDCTDLDRLETPDKFQRKIAEPFGSSCVRPMTSSASDSMISIGQYMPIDVKPDRRSVTI